MKNFAISKMIMSALFLVLTLHALSCSNQTKVYNIGVIGPLTGEGASYGNAMKQGIDMAIDEINVKGGIKGVNLKAIYEDDKLQPKEGINGFNKLVTADKVSIIIGSAASRVTMAIAPLAENKRVVLISPISTTDELINAGDYIFRNVPPNSLQGKTAAQFVIENLKKKNVAIFYKNDDYGANLAKSFREYFKTAKGNIVFDEGYDVEQMDFKNMLSKLKRTNPEVVFFPGNYQDNGMILKQAKENGVSASFIGGDGAFSDELFKIAGNSANGSFYTMMGITKNSKTDDFIEKYKKKFNTIDLPNVFVYYAYDAMMTIAMAIENSGYDSENIKNALYNLKYTGLTGETKFDQYGEVDKPYVIYKVEKGKFIQLNWMP